MTSMYDTGLVEFIKMQREDHFTSETIRLCIDKPALNVTQVAEDNLLSGWCAALNPKDTISIYAYCPDTITEYFLNTSRPDVVKHFASSPDFS